MPFCDLCNGLSIAKLYPPNIYYHANNLAALGASTKDCRLCKMIHWCIETGHEDEDHPQLDFDGASDINTPYEKHEARDKCSVKLQIVPGYCQLIGRKKGFTHVGIWMLSKCMVADLTLSVEEGDELGSRAFIAGEQDSFIFSRVLVSESPPQAHFDVAKRWLDHCEVNHRDCCDRGADSAELPSRVIYVAEEGQNPYLANGNGKRARYVTLSHCWGRSTAVVTTRESLQIRQRSIPLSILPKTFRDAVFVCRKLGIPYLWIDSLCIVQDDEADWERESSHMGSIYYNSTLTLAATDSPDSSTGLFIPRCHFESIHKDIVALPPSFGDHKGQAYITYSTVGLDGSTVTDVENGILQTRAWVMQEKFLARRTLHFLAGQMAWVCCEKILGQSGSDVSVKSWRMSPRMQMKAFAQGFEQSYRCAEPGEDDNGDDEAVLTSKTLHHVATSSSSKHGPASYTIDLRDPRYQTSSPPAIITREMNIYLYYFVHIATRKTVYHVWYSAVRNYSSRRLTFESDKLPALAGIASRVQAITHDDYLAGHWRRELEKSLFWSTNTIFDMCTPVRVKPYRAPSWSWASVDGATFWDFPDLGLGENSPESIKILEASTDVKGGNPFGCVLAGRIIIEASVTRSTWDAEHTGWILTETSSSGPIVPDYGDLRILCRSNSGVHVTGKWWYDDAVNGILPGPLLTPSNSSDEALSSRRVRKQYMPTSRRNKNFYGREFMEIPLWQRGTYVPEELVLVKGPVRKIDEEVRRYYGGRETYVEVLVLAKMERDGEEAEYRRVGIGELGVWDKEVESVEVLTVV